jgi:hypothetical protein
MATIQQSSTCFHLQFGVVARELSNPAITLTSCKNVEAGIPAPEQLEGTEQMHLDEQLLN